MRYQVHDAARTDEGLTMLIDEGLTMLIEFGDVTLGEADSAWSRMRRVTITTFGQAHTRNSATARGYRSIPLRTTIGHRSSPRSGHHTNYIRRRGGRPEP